MARLPDSSALGERPSLSINRRIANVDLSGVGEGAKAAALGEAEGLQRAAAGARGEADAHRIEGQAAEMRGDAGEIRAKGDMIFAQGLTKAGGHLMSAAERFERQREADRKKDLELEKTRADADYFTRRTTIDQERDQDHDPEGFEGRHAPRYAESLQAAAAHISDPRERELFLLRRQADVVQSGARTADRQVALIKDRTLAETQQQLDDLRDKGMKEPDEAKRTEMIRTGRRLIGNLASAGYIDETRAQALDKGWVKGYVVGVLEKQDPRERIMALERFQGSAADRAMQVLRSKEGFRDSTYWDVNAHRVGYGSDTVTRDDGTIRQVKQGDKVSREDAERDLQRRTLESLSQVERTIGKEAFDKLSPNQQAALASITYNYGTLPQRIEGAARSGNVETLARAIESLAGDNDGVNANRRRYEAQLARLPDSSRGSQLAGLLDEDTRSSMLNRAEEEDRQLTLRAERETEAEQRGT